MIRVAKLGKRYKWYPHRWGRLAEWCSGARYVAHQDRWALRDVSFEAGIGEAVGIVGQNGAGKSTLLKILTGTTQPTEGSFALHGRVAALLELGMGFHADFTGRQNAVMGCQMLGLPASEIRRRLPEIATFAELRDHMDQPLRSYSTGMQMRLAFSVATAVRPDVLIVDEALSVGDAYFQHKGTQRIRAFRDAGTTLLFVSHDPGAVRSLCNRALLLDGGTLLREGRPDVVLDYYNALIAKKEKDAEIEQVRLADGRTATRSGDGRLHIVAVELSDAAGRPARAFPAGASGRLRCSVECRAAVDAPTVGLLIRDRLGNDVFGTNTLHLGCNTPSMQPGDRLAVTFELQFNLGPGSYSTAVAVHSGHSHVGGNHDWWDQAVVFQVVPDNAYRFVGTALLPVRASVESGPLVG